MTKDEQIKMLASWGNEQQAIDSINKSIAFGWQGLFLVKTNNTTTLTNRDHANGF